MDLRGRDTRFLGDLYQDLSESVRKKYALLQTPDFVERFILDLTLEPAIETFGLEHVRFIDPTCGSGHFLLGGFKRLYTKMRAAFPKLGNTEVVRRALDATHGVDINPFAVAIARFRLIVEAFQLCEVDSWHTQIAFPIHVATGDSLILGQHFIRFETDVAGHIGKGNLEKYRVDALHNLDDNDLLFGQAQGHEGILTQQYHAVVGNPPYITVKDPGLRDVYKKNYASCSGKYSLVCPFYERFFELAVGPERGQEDDGFKLGQLNKSKEPVVPGGYVGMIVSNAFMKRSYGKKLITEIIPHTDLTHVIDTSGAYVPGHGTPTVILAGRNQKPESNQVRAVLGIRGEPSTPEVPEEGKVWSSIVQNITDPEFENDFVTVSDSDRDLFQTHPWSLQGGGALKCKTILEESCTPLEDLAEAVGITSVTGEDNFYLVANQSHQSRLDTPTKQLVTGEVVRNWHLNETQIAIWPYDSNFEVYDIHNSSIFKHYWLYKNALNRRKRFGTLMVGKGYKWFEWQELYSDRLKTPLTITFAFVATHNHFVLDRGGKVFNRSAPVIKLPEDATIDDHLALLGVLNSSVGQFWARQQFFVKTQVSGMDSEVWSTRLEYDCTKMKSFPVPDHHPTELARTLDQLAQDSAALEPSAIAEATTPTTEVLDEAQAHQQAIFEQMVAFQEELDWRCYELYNLLRDGEAPLVDESQWPDMPNVRVGERAFEIIMARKMESGELTTSWFERRGGTPTTEIPAYWPEWYKELVQRRIELIEERRFIRLIEKPLHKRTWERDAWAKREEDALHLWLLDRLESAHYVPQADRTDAFARSNPKLVRVRDLADIAEKDEAFVAVARRYSGQQDVDIQALVLKLVLSEAAPFLPAQRYKPSGLERRVEWESVWAMQRAEDAIDARTQLDADHPERLSQAQADALKASEVGAIPKPPNYRGGDFQSKDVYKLRGKLDVPKERFILYPDCHLDDGSPVVAWAGLDHKQQAMALAGYYNRVKSSQGWEPERLGVLLAGLVDLLPWLKQWHNDLDPMTNVRLGDFLESFVAQQAMELEFGGVKAIEQLRIGAP